MTGRDAPKLQDSQLLAYIDGEVSDTVASQIEQSPEHLERAQQLALVQQRLIAHLYRCQCPSSLELGEYHLGILPMEQSQSISHHLQECPHCREEISQLETYLTDTSIGLGCDDS